LTSTSTSNATELRVVPMFVMNNTVLREVLLICTPCRSINARELSLTADPFVGSTLAERLPPAGERQTNAIRPSRNDDSLGGCLERAGEAGRDRCGVCATVRVVAFVELA
jgi:hypothetical protein